MRRAITFSVINILEDVIGVKAVLMAQIVGFNVDVLHLLVDTLHGEVAVALLLVVLEEQQCAPPAEVQEHRTESLCHFPVGWSDAGQLRVLALLVAESGGQGTCRDHRDLPVRGHSHHRRRLVLAHRAQDQVRLAAAGAVQQSEVRVVDALRALKVEVEVEARKLSSILLQLLLGVLDRWRNSRVRKKVGIILRQKDQHLYFVLDDGVWQNRLQEHQKVHAHCAEI